MDTESIAELPATGAPGPLLRFETCGVSCAIPLVEVQELVEVHPITRVPTAPRSVLGVFNLRGHVVPVLDLASRLGLRPATLGKRSCLIVLSSRERDETSLVALLVDSVDEIVEPASVKLEEVPGLGTPIAKHLLEAVLQTGNGLVHVLSLEPLLGMQSGGEDRN